MVSICCIELSTSGSVCPHCIAYVADTFCPACECNMLLCTRTGHVYAIAPQLQPSIQCAHAAGLWCCRLYRCIQNLIQGQHYSPASHAHRHPLYACASHRADRDFILGDKLNIKIYATLQA